MISNFVSDDLTREEVVDRYRKRIIEGSRTKLTRIEREQLAFLLLETLIHLSEAGEDSKDVIRSLCQEEIDLLEEGYPQTSIHTSYLPIYVRLIKDAIASGQLKLTDLNSYEKASSSHIKSGQGTEWVHYALDFLAYNNDQQRHSQAISPEKYEENSEYALLNVDLYLKRVQELLSSNATEEIAIALCALTGQHQTDLICGEQFEETDFPYLMRYQKLSKKTTSVVYSLTLIPVQDILPHIQRWQKIKAHGNGESSHIIHKRAFVTRLNHRIRKVFEFSQIVPVINGSKTVSIQRLRDIYGAIALHFFCPSPPHQHHFLQHYLSHLLEEKHLLEDFDIKDIQHHFRYIPAQDNKIMPTIGVKLPKHGSVPLLGVKETLEPKQVNPQENQPTPSQALETSLSPQPSPEPNALEPVISTQVRTIADQAQALNWLTAEIQTLREQVQQLQADREEAIAQVHEFPALQQECQQLRQENQTLRLAQRKVDAFKALLLDAGVERDYVKSSAEYTQASTHPSQSASLSKSSKRQKRKLSSSSGQPLQSSPSTTAEAETGSSDSTLKKQQAATVLNYRLLPTKASKAQQRAASIVAAIQSWNHQHPNRSFAITKGLLEHEFGINRKAASEFMEGNRQTLLDYYQAIGVKNERGHNRQPGRDIETLRNFVAEVFQQLS